MALLDLFKTDVDEAESYLGYDSDELRRAWVNRELKKMGFPDSVIELPDPSDSDMVGPSA